MEDLGHEISDLAFRLHFGGDSALCVDMGRFYEGSNYRLQGAGITKNMIVRAGYGHVRDEWPDRVLSRWRWTYIYAHIPRMIARAC